MVKKGEATIPQSTGERGGKPQPPSYFPSWRVFCVAVEVGVVSNVVRFGFAGSFVRS